MRGGKLCWFRTNNLGVSAINDSGILEMAGYKVLTDYCRGRPFYSSLMDLFQDV